jgi:hypothetical protein
LTRLALALGAGLAGCGAPVVEPEPIPDDYVDWYRVDATGRVAGHGDSYRIIYVNEVGTGFPGSGRYGEGTVIVKEIRDRDGDEPGALRYLAVMRKLAEPPDGGELQGGWLFTYLGSIDSAEENRPSCWDRCHQAAPIDGAFLDYGQ